MKLTEDILPTYFTVASAANSHYETNTNTFNFINRDSDILVVTVGDSWTWGSDLPEEDRLTQVYGNIVSDRLSADWLNLGQPGSSNFFIAERVEELGRIISKLSYQKIYLICTFTEIGRGINSHHDMHVDYYNWFQQTHIECSDDFYKLLDFLNRDCLNRIRAVADRYNLELLVGTNFVNAIGINSDPGFLPEPWFKLLNITCPVIAYAGNTGVNRIKDLIEIVPDELHLLFKEWTIKIIDQSCYIDQVCCNKLLMNTHPLSDGHSRWAEYILQNIK